MNYKVEVRTGSNWDNISNHFFATLEEANAFVELFNNSKNELDSETLAVFCNAF